MSDIRSNLLRLMKDRGYNPKSLSLAAGKSHTFVRDILERGANPRGDSLAALAKTLGCTISELLGTPDSSQQPETQPLRAFPVEIGPDRIPIYGQAACGNEGRFEMNGEVLGYAPLIPQLANVKDAYAVYVAGDSMEPRYYSGEIVYVNPLRPARQGNFVVIQLKPDVNGDAPYGFVKRFVSMSATEVHLEQFNPKMPITYPRGHVVSIHRIVGTFDEM